MSNPYLSHYQKKRLIETDSYDEFGFMGIGDAWDTATRYYGKQYNRGGGGVSGVGKILTGTTSDLYVSVRDYEQTNKDAARRNERAWERKVEIAKIYRNLPAWPKGQKKFLSLVRKAYPEAPNWSWALAIPPNSIADAYAQGAFASYLTALMWNRPLFKKLGDSFLEKAEHWGRKGKKPINTDSFLMSVIEPYNVINVVGTLFLDKSGVDITKGAPVAKVMKGIVSKWLTLAYETGIITKTTDLKAQIKNVISGNNEKEAKNFLKILRNNAKPNEIKFSQNLAAESQAELTDLAYNMRGVFLAGGMAIAGVVLFPYIAPLIAPLGNGLIGIGKAAGKGIGAVGKGIGAVGKGTGKLISSLPKKDAEKAYLKAATAAEKGNVKEFVNQVKTAKSLSPYPVSLSTENELINLENLAALNTAASPTQMKRVLKQVLVESQGQRI